MDTSRGVKFCTFFGWIKLARLPAEQWSDACKKHNGLAGRDEKPKEFAILEKFHDREVNSNQEKEHFQILKVFENGKLWRFHKGFGPIECSEIIVHKIAYFSGQIALRPFSHFMAIAGLSEPGVPGRAPPDFGRSVNPISTRGGRLCPPHYYLPTQL